MRREPTCNETCTEHQILREIADYLCEISESLTALTDFTRGAVAGFTGVLSGRLRENMQELLNLVRQETQGDFQTAAEAAEAIDPTPCTCKHPRHEHLDGGPCLVAACPCENFA